MREMLIYGISFDTVGRQPIVLLKTADEDRILPIWIGHPEAAAILVKLQGASSPRPMTHDLVTDMLDQLDAEVVRVAVTELRDNTFYALITLRLNGSEIEIDSRPSDAIALAVRADAKIFAAEEVIDESGIALEDGEPVEDVLAQLPPLSESDLPEFQRFLDEVTPEDFAAADEPRDEDD